MPSPIVVLWVVRLAGFYLAAGVLFAVAFAFRWVDRQDPVAARGTRPFRFLLFPGAMLLWPGLLTRVVRREIAPPMERNAHRSGAA